MQFLYELRRETFGAESVYVDDGMQAENLLTSNCEMWNYLQKNQFASLHGAQTMEKQFQ